MQYLLTQEELDKLKQPRESHLTITLMRNTILDAEKVACKNWNEQNIRFVENQHFRTNAPREMVRPVKRLSSCKECPMVVIYLYIISKFPDNYIQQGELQKTICPEMEYKDVRS